MDATKMFFHRNRDRLVSESVNQSARKWKFQLISGLERKLPLGKGRWCMSNICAECKRNLFECHDRLVNELEARFNSMSHLQTVFTGLSSQAIMDDTGGELELKFKIIGSE